MKQCFLNLFVFTIIIISAIDSSSAASNTITVNGIRYNVNNSNNTAVVTTTTIAGDVTIPSTFIYGKYTYTVVSIGYEAFQNNTELISINIPNTVESIGQYAFMSCKSLVKVKLPDNLTEIDNGTFMYCSSLNSIVIPESVEVIAINAFYYCI